jgi:uncharacterized phiE125 gp8 family phage protein
MSEPVSLTQAKTHLRLDVDDTGEDSYLTGLITAARRACELRIHRSIVGAQLVLELDAFPSTLNPATMPIEVQPANALALALPGGSLASVDSVTYRDGQSDTQTLDPAAYITDFVSQPGRIAPVADWPATAADLAEIRITYTVSPLSPDDLAVAVQAMLLLIEGWYSNRGSVAVDVRGIPTEIPLSVTWLLEPLKQWATD